MLEKPLKVLFTVISILATLQRVAAQTADITCDPGWMWSFNTLGQTSCIVASYLNGVCHGGSNNITALPPGGHYSGPPTSPGDGCECNSVIYALTMACGNCQNQSTIIGWDAWAMNCGHSYYQEYPYPVPVGTSVPAWAYLDWNTVGGGTFNDTAAQQDLAPESTAGSAPLSTTSSSTSSATSTPSSAPQLTGSSYSTASATSSPSNHSSSHASTGAIAGGVVGGFAGLVIVIGAIAWYLRRRAGATSARHFSLPSTDPSIRQHTSQRVGTPLRLYDPDDPSTFPSSIEI